jgi:arginine deiminase
VLAHDKAIGMQFVEDFLEEADVWQPNARKLIGEWLFDNFSNKEIIDQLIAGLRVRDIPNFRDNSLAGMVARSYPFLTNPLPNVLFTRDPFATIGNGVTVNHMRKPIRRRETLMADYIFKYHPSYQVNPVPRWFNRDAKSCLEGGDELVINETTLFIGISERTDAMGIETLAQSIFYKHSTSFQQILAFLIPHKRAFMHLDTVFTQIDHDKFTIHPGIEGDLTVYTLKRGAVAGSISITEEHEHLETVLARVLDRKVTLLRCGGDDVIAGDREQWNDGANTLAIAPGEVCTYSRNHVTNELLEQAGIKVHLVPSSELSRGRGGPRCMSMPLVRELL